MTTSFACERFVTVEEFFDWGQCGCQLDEVEDADLIGAALDNASDILSLSTDGRVTGVCESTVHPVGEGSCWPTTLNPYYSGVGASHLLEATIPLRGPNTQVVSVVVGGVTLDEDDYELLNGNYLVRRGGSWPSGSWMDADSFTVTYRFGRPVDLITRNATIEMACELASFYATGRTNLPKGVVSANIQGASLSLREEADRVTQYLPRVGAFLAVYAPTGRNQTGGIWSPELGHGWELIRVNDT